MVILLHYLFALVHVSAECVVSMAPSRKRSTRRNRSSIPTQMTPKPLRGDRYPVCRVQLMFPREGRIRICTVQDRLPGSDLCYADSAQPLKGAC